MGDSLFEKPRSRFFKWGLGKTIEIKEKDRVTLPVILGIRPGYYLAVLYGAALLIVLFFILIFPGIINPGSLGVFTSEPQGAAIRVDGITLGYTPCEIFIPQGKRRIDFILPGFDLNQRDLEVKGSILGSRFFPRKIAITGTLTTSDPAGVLARAALEYMHWSAVGEPTVDYQIPLRLSEGAYRAGPAAADPAVRKTMQAIMENSLRHAVTRAAVRDLVRAQFLVDNGGLSPAPLSALASIQKAASSIGKNSGSSFWLAEILPENAAAALVQSAWFTKTAGNSDQGTIGIFDLPFQAAGSMTLENLGFVSVNSGYLEKHGRRESIPPMLIARFPVTVEAWDAFTGENPEWSGLKRDELIARGRAGAEYLLPLDNPAYPYPAAPGISWYAAEAYCAWLTTKLPPSLAGWEVRLPSEAEWEFAARQRGLNQGLLWEWCADPFAPLDFFPAPEEALELLGKAAGIFPPERVVRGGSWINPPGSTGIESRGSLPPESSSYFVGCRPVIVPKRGS
jgi:hypothetical protein